MTNRYFPASFTSIWPVNLAEKFSFGVCARGRRRVGPVEVDVLCRLRRGRIAL